MEEVSRECSDKLNQTQRKLDQFYEIMDVMRRNQYMVSKRRRLEVRERVVISIASLPCMHTTGFISGFHLRGGKCIAANFKSTKPRWGGHNLIIAIFFTIDSKIMVIPLLLVKVIEWFTHP